jgi:hypothetical protein
LEGGPFGSRQIGKCDNDRKDQYQYPYQLFGRFCPVAVEAVDVQVPLYCLRFSRPSCLYHPAISVPDVDYSWLTSARHMFLFNGASDA